MRLGVAAFVDVASASRGFSSQAPGALVDVGAGIRVRLPGSGETIRADYAHGVRDGHDAVTFAIVARRF